MLSKAIPPATRPIANLQGLAYLSLSANTESTYSPDRDYWLSELKFYSANDISAATIKLTVGGQTLFGGSGIPLSLLQDRVSANSQAAAAKGVYVFKLPQPVPMSRANPLKITSSAACEVFAVGLDPTAL